MSQSPILLNLDVRFHDLLSPQMYRVVTKSLKQMYVRNHWIHDTLGSKMKTEFKNDTPKFLHRGYTALKHQKKNNI